MTTSAQILASGPGWQVRDVVCTAGPHDRPFEEVHTAACIAAVTRGTFQYRTPHGVAVLAPGALVLGNHGDCFECSHDHSTGDRCLAFLFAPDYLDGIVAALPGARRSAFALPRLPPLEPLMRLLAAAEAARDDGDAAALAELALRLAGAAVAAASGLDAASRRPPSRRDARRVSDALRRIEESADETLTLDRLAGDAATSPYHFLRVFHEVVGMTPHQFVLRTRMHRAAVRLRRSGEPIAAIAFDVGFNDLSTFNRRFRRVMGASPSAYRARRA
jgi:AraC family transcriptional regulator